MKRVLITGANSYIGTNVEKWLGKYPDKYSVNTVDMKNESWRNRDFSGFDVVFHVAGIAHVSSNPRLKDLYYKVNRDLTIETAEKAKREGVKQLIFMSSIIVYGDSGRIGERKVINRNTVPQPTNFYGDSKLQAEKGLIELQSDGFKVAILRPPMIYGKGCKGNYNKLVWAAKYLPIFPDIENERSMLHIDNLCEFVRLIIDNEENGVFFPQNAEYVKTSEMVRLIARAHGKEIRLFRALNGILIPLGDRVGIMNKVFGSLVYEQNMSRYKTDYRVSDLQQSIEATEIDTKS